MVILRTVTGDRGFMHGHEPCSVVLDAGVMRILRGEGQEEYKLAVLGGVAQIEDNIVTVLTETAEWPEEIDKNKAAIQRDEALALLEKVTPAERERLRYEIRGAETLILVGGFPPSGITHDK
jgi:F-type H+-transporting ATPase subunit epsilon